VRVARVVAAAVAAYVAIIGITLWQANSDRADRGRAQEPRIATTGAPAFRVTQSDVPFRSDVWTTISMAAISTEKSPPHPPGLTEFPQPGESWVSPAVRRAVSSDSSLRTRVPGKIVGTMSSAGLQSPDQFFVYTGVADIDSSAWAAEAFGARTEITNRPAIPRPALSGLICLLVGLPALLLVYATGRMSALSRARTTTTCFWLGVPRATLTSAAAVDAGLCAVLGSGVGATAAALTAAALHDTTALGIAWYPLPARVQLMTALSVMLATSALAAWQAAKFTAASTTGRSPMAANGPAPARRRRLAPLVVGSAGLLGLVIPFVVAGYVPPNIVTVSYLFGIGPVVIVGAFLGLPQVIRGAASRLRPVARRTWMHLGVRRLWWDSDRLALALGGLMVSTIASMTGAGALADLEGLSQEAPGGDQFALTLSSDAAAQLLAIPAEMRFLSVTARDGRTTTIGTCADFTSSLRDAVGSSVPASAPREFARRCQEGQPAPVVAGTDRWTFSGLSTYIDDPAQHSGPARSRELLVYPGEGPDAVGS
jgi:hypothetical protein